MVTYFKSRKLHVTEINTFNAEIKNPHPFFVIVNTIKT